MSYKITIPVQEIKPGDLLDGRLWQSSFMISKPEPGTDYLKVIRIVHASHISGIVHIYCTQDSYFTRTLHTKLPVIRKVDLKKVFNDL